MDTLLRLFAAAKYPDGIIRLETKIQACLLYLAGLPYRGMKYQTRIMVERYGLRWLHITFGERNAIEVLQDDEGEDETILQQPTLNPDGQSPIVLDVFMLVKPSQKASRTRRI